MTQSAREEEWANWLRLAIKGDAQAYSRFLFAVTPHLRAMARRRCGLYGAPLSEAEDVVQEVLLAIHLKRGTWDPARPLGPWLTTLVLRRVAAPAQPAAAAPAPAQPQPAPVQPAQGK